MNHDYRKRNGIYYTPEVVANLLSRWAVRSSSDIVLDPSHGGGVFLKAAFQALVDIGASKPHLQIRGVDIDPASKSLTKELIDTGVPSRYLICNDFFAIDPSDMPGVTVVVGNPPYVRHHLLSHELGERARLAVSRLHLGRRASYWAYFVIHSTAFLEQGGRMAMILPEALLQADYANSVREHLIRSFGRIHLYVLRERLFSRTEESSVVLLAEEKGKRNTVFRMRDLETLDDLKKCLSENTTESTKGNTPLVTWHQGLVSGASGPLIDKIIDRLNGFRLGDVATVKIGAVTGANDFFVINRDIQYELGITDRHIQPIISRSAQLRGKMELTTHHLIQLLNSKNRVRLIFPSRSNNLPSALKRYFSLGEAQGINLRYKCTARDPWYIITDVQQPNAFLTYMSWTGPRIVLNSTRADCTNTVHRLTWTSLGTEINPAAIALGFLSSVSQILTEILGRSYGGGVLKLEPTSAKKIWIPLLRGNIDDLFAAVSKLVASERLYEATLLIDDFLVSTSSLELHEVRLLQRELQRLRHRRKGWRSAGRVVSD